MVILVLGGLGSLVPVQAADRGGNPSAPAAADPKSGSLAPVNQTSGCLPGQTLAAWTFDSGGSNTSPTPSIHAVGTAVISVGPGLMPGKITFESSPSRSGNSWAAYELSYG